MNWPANLSTFRSSARPDSAFTALRSNNLQRTPASQHDLPFFSANRRNRRRRFSHIVCLARITETGPRSKVGETFTPLARGWDRSPHDCVRLEFLVTRYHGNGRVLQFPAATPHRFANWFCARPVVRG